MIHPGANLCNSSYLILLLPNHGRLELLGLQSFIFERHFEFRIFVQIWGFGPIQTIRVDLRHQSDILFLKSGRQIER